MNELAKLVLGLGLFFLGMQLVGDSLRHLSGPSFRFTMTRFTKSRWAASGLGLLFGALMQSATAVTFILVSMVSSGLIAAEAALPVITWTNVGLTALAFVVTFDIHPLVVWGVGLSGIAAATVRRRIWKQVAWVLLGISLLFYGLQTMGDATAPLQHWPWFQTILSHIQSYPGVAFIIGFALAASLQSNTGATLLVITLAASGAIQLPTAMMLIYGTNLGAILLRLLLSTGLHGASRLLVRYEDLFCVVSGLLMASLYYVEQATGVPLVRAAVTALSSDLRTQLALVFLLSNLLPAVILSPAGHRCLAFLARIWPAEMPSDTSRPKYLTPQALADPSTAVDLLPREMARLLQSLERAASKRAHRSHSESEDQQRAADFATLAGEIEAFADRLTIGPLPDAVVARLSALRESLSVIRYLEDAYEQFCRSLDVLETFPASNVVTEAVLSTLATLFAVAAQAMDTLSDEKIAQLREQSRKHSALIEQTRARCISAGTGNAGALSVPQRAAMLKLVSDFELLTWIVHRLSKLLERASQIRGHATFS